MNIEDYWPSPAEVKAWTLERQEVRWGWLWELRSTTWKGFAEIEAKNGIVKPKVSLNTSYGQEVTRVILFRILEEASESILAEDIKHKKEELIDALNYLMSVFLLDKDCPSGRVLAELFTMISEDRVKWGSTFTTEQLGTCTLLLTGILPDKFRNRAWMNQAQDFYFSGRDVLTSTLLESASLMLSAFDDHMDFMKYFVAKDRVLQFRLQSKY